MFVLARIRKFGSKYSVLDTDDGIVEIIEESSLRDLISENEITVVNCGDCVYTISSKYLFVLTWYDGWNYFIIKVYNKFTGDLITLDTVFLKFECKNVFIMSIDYFKLKYSRGILTVYLYDKHFYGEDIGQTFKTQLKFKNESLSGGELFKKVK